MMLSALMRFFSQVFDMFFKSLEVEPERPNHSGGYDKPDIVRVKGVRFKLQGKYKTPSGRARGLVVHYTVSGSSSSNAQGVLKYLASRGLGCMVMDRAGTIYIAENVELEESVAWHAGTSSWKGKTGLSRYCMGMEICSWGKLNSSTKPRVTGDIRESVEVDNIKAGEYEAYSDAQEKALRDFILWQLDVNDEFEIDYVVGHDEIAPGRKSDPGASLSMTMPAYRSYLRGQ
jgi:N-acetyl-anhydromuramyl-L-alanine amidase AmpD